MSVFGYVDLLRCVFLEDGGERKTVPREALLLFRSSPARAFVDADIGVDVRCSMVRCSMFSVDVDVRRRDSLICFSR